MENMEGKELFLSHAAGDAELAAFLEITAKRAIPGVEVFRTSRVGGIPTGRAWFLSITEHLRSADRFLILLSKLSMSKPWVGFEVGAAWYSSKILVPVMAPGLTPEEIVEPLRQLQLLSLDEPIQAQQAFSDLGGELDDPAAFVTRAKELAARGRLVGIRERFHGLEYGDKFYAYEGPLHELPLGDAVPMPTALPEAFRAAGFEPVMTIPSRPETTFAAGYQWVWLIDEWGQKRPMLDRERTQLCVKKVK